MQGRGDDLGKNLPFQVRQVSKLPLAKVIMSIKNGTVSEQHTHQWHSNEQYDEEMLYGGRMRKTFLFLLNITVEEKQ